MFMPQYKGVSANNGVAIGKLCVVNDPAQFNHCTSEHIVLLNKVKPTALLAKTVKAILAVHGGITSHAAIVARENNKPAIVGLPEDMLNEVKDGDEINVDADNGVVDLKNN